MNLRRCEVVIRLIHANVSRNSCNSELLVEWVTTLSGLIDEPAAEN
jgi:hypothetical protein